MILRAKTLDLLQTRSLTEQQKLNSSLNLEETKLGKTFLSSFPRRIVLEITNACNIKCIMCGRDEADFIPNFMDLSVIQELEDVLHKIEEVTLFGWGEPTIHPNFPGILEYLNRFPIRKYFVTNGMRLENIKRKIFDYHVDIMAVSLDGACAATNDRIRCGSKFEQVTSTLSDIVQEKQKRGTDYPYINFVFTAMRSNLQELPDLVRLAHKIGLQEVKVVYLTTFTENLIHESLWNCQDEVRMVFEEAAQLAGLLGIKLKLPYCQGEDIAGEKLHKNCNVGWRDLFIGSDGFIRPCQSTAVKLSKFCNKSFQNIWNSSEFQDFRDRVNDPQRMPGECRRCYQSSHANWNKKESFLQIGLEFAPDWEKGMKSDG